MSRSEWPPSFGPLPDVFSKDVRSYQTRRFSGIIVRRMSTLLLEYSFIMNEALNVDDGYLTFKKVKDAHASFLSFSEGDERCA